MRAFTAIHYKWHVTHSLFTPVFPLGKVTWKQP